MASCGLTLIAAPEYLEEESRPRAFSARLLWAVVASELESSAEELMCARGGKKDWCVG